MELISSGFLFLSFLFSYHVSFTDPQNTGDSATVKKKRKRVIGEKHKQYLARHRKQRRKAKGNKPKPGGELEKNNTTQPALGPVLEIEDKLVDKAKVTSFVDQVPVLAPLIPDILLSEDKKSLLPDSYVLYVMPLNKDRIPQVQDLYEVERFAVPSSVPVVGDFVPAALIDRLVAIAANLPDLRGLVQAPFAKLNQTLGGRSNLPTKKGLSRSHRAPISLPPFVTPSSLPPPPPPVELPVTAPTYRLHREEKRRGPATEGSRGSQHGESVRCRQTQPRQLSPIPLEV